MILRRGGAERGFVTNTSPHAIRWGISLTALWAFTVLLAVMPTTASAHPRGSRVVVMEDAGAGNGPERAVQGLGRSRRT